MVEAIFLNEESAGLRELVKNGRITGEAKFLWLSDQEKYAATRKGSRMGIAFPCLIFS